MSKDFVKTAWPVGRFFNSSKAWKVIAGIFHQSLLCGFLTNIRVYRPTAYRNYLRNGWRNISEVFSRSGRESLVWQWSRTVVFKGRRCQIRLAGLWRGSGLTQPVLEAILTILVAGLPWLSALPASGTGWALSTPWGIILQVMILLWLTTPNLTYPEKGSGLFLFWLSLLICAGCAAGRQADLDKIGMMAVFLLMSRLCGVIFTRDRALKLLKVLTFSSLIWMFIGWRQLLGAPTPPGWLGESQSQTIAVRIYSVFGNPNVFAIYLLPILCWAHYFEKEAGLIWQKIAFGAVLGSALITLYFTYSRTAWFIAAFYGAIWFFSNTGPRVAYKKVIIAAGVALILWITQPDLRIRILSLLSGHDGSVTSRPLIWHAVWQAIQPVWFWGAGPGAFAAVYPWHGGAAPWAAHAHQQYLQIWLENGLPSLLIFWYVIRRTVFRFLRPAGGGRSAARAVGLGLLGFLIIGFTDTWSASPFLGGFFWFMIGMGGVLNEQRSLPIYF